MKVRLLSNPGYLGLSAVPFPVEVQAERDGDEAYVLGRELIRVGADADAFDEEAPYYWTRHGMEVLS